MIEKKTQKDASRDAERTLKALTSAVNTFTRDLKSVPDNIAKHLATQIKADVAIREDVTTGKGSVVEVINLKQLEENAREIKELLSKPADKSVEVENLDDIEFDTTELNKSLTAIIEAVQKIEVRPQVTVRAPATKINWPKKPEEAIPVVLTDPLLKQFYRAVATGGGTLIPTALRLWDGTNFVTITNNRLNVNMGGLLIPEHNSGEVSYPTNTREIYTYKQNSTTVGTLTINYVDSTKEQIADWTLA